MGDNTKIEWADHTFNPWIGCQKVGPGCDNCYAEAMMDTRYGRVKWGPGQDRSITSTANWRKPLAWNRDAAKTGTRPRVFCASLADVFDNAVRPEWRSGLWDLINQTPHLDWLLLTKRPGNIAAMLPTDWGTGWPNVWLGCTVVNREEMLRDGPKLRAIPATVRFWSAEPLLGDIGEVPREIMPSWVITGGESGPKARPMHPDWVRSLRDQCQAEGMAFHFKQWGEWGPDTGPLLGHDPIFEGKGPCAFFNDGTWHQSPNGFTVDLEASRGCGAFVYRLGKKLNGRLLDGREWNELPGLLA